MIINFDEVIDLIKNLNNGDSVTIKKKDDKLEIRISQTKEVTNG